jgi:hypothetical protein
MLPGSPSKRKVSQGFDGLDRAKLSRLPDDRFAERLAGRSETGRPLPGGDHDRPTVTIRGLTFPLTDEELVGHEPARAQGAAP